MGMGRSSSRLASRRIRTTISSASLHTGAANSSESHGSSTRLSGKSSNSDWTSNMAGLEESDDEEEEDDDWLSSKKSRDRTAKRRRATAKGSVASGSRVKRPNGRNGGGQTKKAGGPRLQAVASAPNIIDYSKLGTERNPGEVGPAGFHFSSEIFDTESVDYFIGGGSEVTSLIDEDNFSFEGDTADILTSDRSGSGLR